MNGPLASESNNHHFELELSADGNRFIKVGEVKSKAENGNSSTQLTYAFTVEAPANLAIGAGIGLFLLGSIGFGFGAGEKRFSV